MAHFCPGKEQIEGSVSHVILVVKTLLGSQAALPSLAVFLVSVVASLESVVASLASVIASLASVATSLALVAFPVTFLVTSLVV